jgi:AcrR family transcriptional regulator
LHQINLTINFNQMDKNKKTQKSILKAAKRTFLQQGFGGARMQEIADLAKVNKALLHYYFRSKEQLFREVLEAEVQKVAGIFSILEKEGLPFQDKLRDFSSTMLHLSQKDPDCLPFLLQAARLFPHQINPPLAERLGLEGFLAQVRTGMSHGFIPGKDPEALGLRLLALTMLFPLAGDLMQALFGEDACTRFREELPPAIQSLVTAPA